MDRRVALQLPTSLFGQSHEERRRGKSQSISEELSNLVDGISIVVQLQEYIREISFEINHPNNFLYISPKSSPKHSNGIGFIWS